VIGLSSRATENSRFEGDKFQVLFWKNPENSRLELTTYLQAKLRPLLPETGRNWLIFINCTMFNSRSL